MTRHVSAAEIVKAQARWDAVAGYELIVDFFAGGGGTSEGVQEGLGRSPDIAANHDEFACAMHRLNHPKTLHLQQDVWGALPTLDRLIGNRPVGFFWASPDCKHFSKAKGGRPVKRKIRDLAWIVPKFARRYRPRVIMLENVEEFRDWGPLVQKSDEAGAPVVDLHGNPVMVPCKRRKGETFHQWVAALQRLGYRVEWRDLRACNLGAPTLRKRLFLIARRDGRPIVWSQPSHAERGAGGLKPWRTAAACIDWERPCPSIFLTRAEGRARGVNRPLAPATMARIAKGVKRYVIDAAKPFIVPVKSWGGGGNAPADIDAPLRTTTASKRGEHALVTPFVTKFHDGQVGQSLEAPLATITANSFINRPGGAAPLGIVAPVLSTYYGEGEGGDVRANRLDEPLRTQTTENRHALVAATLEPAPSFEDWYADTKDYGGSREEYDRLYCGAPPPAAAALLAAHLMTMRNADKPCHDPARPAPTITADGARQTLVAAFMAQHNTDVVGHDMRAPVSTIVGLGCTQALAAAHLVSLKGSDRRDGSIEAPAPAITAGGYHVGEVRAFLMKYYGADQRPDLLAPLHTVTSKDRFGLVTVAGVDYCIVDIGMRMLTPRELFRAQGFRDSYCITHGIFITKGGARRKRALTKTVQVRMVGNSVSPVIPAALTRDNVPELAVARIRRRRPAQRRAA